MTIADPKMRDLLTQAYVIGGSPCSGKSTVAERLSQACNLHYYKADDRAEEHLERCDPARHPVMHRYGQMSWNEIWMRPVSTQVDEEFGFYREHFEMILQDLEAYDPGKPIVLEGAALLPELLGQCEISPSRVVFLVPTLEFQLHHYSQRSWVPHALEGCVDPEQAFDNWMMRDHHFGLEILRQAEARDYKTILVDGTLSVDEMYERIGAYLGLVCGAP